MAKSHKNLNKYITDFRYNNSMSNLISERYRTPYRENSRAIDDKFRVVYFYQSTNGCQIMNNPSEKYEDFEIITKNKEFNSFHAKNKRDGKIYVIFLQSADAPRDKDKYSFISDIAKKHILLEDSIGVGYKVKWKKNIWLNF